MRSRLAELTEYHEVSLPKWLELRLWLRFLAFDFTKFDAVIFDLRFRFIRNQIDFFIKLSSKTQIYFLEEDACQNFLEGSQHFQQFSKFYKAIPNVKVLCSGYITEQKLRANGINAWMVPKGYDEQIIQDLGQHRDIGLGFLGKFTNPVYSKRKEIIETLERESGLIVLHTKPGAEYVEALNRINFFVSADAGLDEYMVKNYEALGAGCVLIAYRMGQGEEEALGFKDMENIVLYSNLEELHRKIDYLKANPMEMECIRLNGKRHVTQKLSFRAQAENIVDILNGRESKVRTENLAA